MQEKAAKLAIDGDEAFSQLNSCLSKRHGIKVRPPKEDFLESVLGSIGGTKGKSICLMAWITTTKSCNPFTSLLC